MLFCGDVAAIILAGLSAAGFWEVILPGAETGLLYRLWPLILAFPAGYLFGGLYPAAGVSPVDELRLLSVVTSFVFGSAIIITHLSQDAYRWNGGIFLLAWLFTLVSVPLVRAVLRHLLARRSWWGVPVVVLGAGRTGETVIQRLQANPGLSLKVVACFDDAPGLVGSTVHGVPVLGSLKAAATARRDYGALHAIIAMPGIAPSSLTALVRRYASVFPHLVMVPNLFGMASIGLSTRDLAGIVGLHVRQNLLIERNRVFKCSIDLLLLVPALCLALPLILLGAVAVTVVSPGNPFYSQEREGEGRKRFRVWKLRTMHLDAEGLLKRTLREDSAARTEWERHYKLTKDPRILPVIGPLLRRTSIDELPQLWNILRGQMSFVGPRPFPYYHIEQFSEEFRELRSSVRPGLTGMWQVTSRSTADLEAQEQLDTHYIRNWSLWMDIYLLARTPWAVLFGKGAY
jgi:Undecaprenyl-phosphate galactose phosphotransferase WbaP